MTRGLQDGIFQSLDFALGIPRMEKSLLSLPVKELQRC